jgi:hypothetical protein
MALTLAQLTAFKDDIQANPDQTVIDALALGAHNTIANWYNGETADFWIFKQLVPLAEVSEAIELDDVANMTTGDNEKLKTFFTIRSSGVFATKLADRSGFDDIFSAAAGDDSQQALIALWKRLATEAEKLFSGGTGAGTNGDPADGVFEGNVSSRDVTDALNS